MLTKRDCLGFPFLDGGVILGFHDPGEEGVIVGCDDS